jgi:hypothetical protein
VGEWLSGCSIDICIITSLKADRTFSERFDEKNLADPVVSGTWRTEGNQLVLHVTSQLQAKTVPSVLGRDLRYIISDLQPNALVAAYTDTKSDPVHWKRLK